MLAFSAWPKKKNIENRVSFMCAHTYSSLARVYFAELALEATKKHSLNAAAAINYLSSLAFWRVCHVI